MTSDSDKKLPPCPAEQRPLDEHANFITHALGFLLSVPASAVLMTVVFNHHSASIVVACGIYCFTLMGLYAASALSHTFHDLAWRRFFRTVDQVFIFLLIAGSFTPWAVLILWHGWWRMLLVVMWSLAILGVLLVVRMRSLTSAARLTYGFLGWLPVVALKELFDAVSLDSFLWFLAGGIFYSAGALFLRFDRHVRYFHALWHTFVIAGSTSHYVAILLVLL